MSAKKDLPPKDPKAIGYWVADPIPKRFLQQPKFCLHFQEYLQSLFRIELVIMLQQPEREDGSWWNKPPPGYMIQLLAGEKNKEMGQAVSDFCRNYFNSIQSETVYSSQGMKTEKKKKAF
ncbi:hypothetical protein I4U23_015439 [Adineta vaga]|nr:hypothetical protein I4U23_015439 [Adineta vaga]